MATEIQALAARMREERGSTASRRLRREGELPCILGGLGEEPVSIAVPERAFRLYHTAGGRIVSLKLGKDEEEALIREIQWDALGEKILHVDFERVKAGQKIEVRITLEFFGDPIGVTEGGVFQTLTDRVSVSVLPSQIPEMVEVNVTELQIGDEIRVKDIEFPKGVEVVSDGEELVVLISAPVVEAEEEAEDLLEDGAEEPEVIGEDKETEKEEQD